MAASLPALLAEIQVHLMDCLSLILSRTPFSTVCHKEQALALVAANAQGQYMYSVMHELEGWGGVGWHGMGWGGVGWGGIHLIGIMMTEEECRNGELGVHQSVPPPARPSLLHTAGELKEAGLIKLALQTLATFNFDMVGAAWTSDRYHALGSS
jgi:hypothetical protein